MRRLLLSTLLVPPLILPAQSPPPAPATPPSSRSGATPVDDARARAETTGGQQLASLGDPPLRATTATANLAVATRARLAPVIDGKDDDPVWAQAQIIDSFRQFQPEEDSTPSFRTVAKVVYDDKYLYVFVRMYDPHPDSIVALLSRRDVHTQSDWIKVMLDSYHDKRSGYEFAVNARGVKRDYYMYNDSQEDDSWDGIWDVATTVDSLGWTAEFQIPFDQLRFAPAPNLTMGLGIWRDIARYNERDSWPVYRRSKPGISSQIGEITGIEGLGSPRHVEVVPYVVAKNVTWPDGPGYQRQQEFTGGADLKYGVTTNLTLDGTVNPDFGQVESDPALLNLSAFETFLPEKRPFFVEGTGIFHLDVGCNNGACTGLFYSRRIGRQPQLSDGSLASPTATPIYGAAKLTGRLSNGLSVGVLDALTAQADNSDGSTAEPPTNYFAARAIQEYDDGQGGVGAMVTATNRQNDEWTSPYLRTSAYTGGLDFRKQFSKRQYELTGYVVGSSVSGSDSAMLFTQENSTHYYQRPGSGLPFDTSRTSLAGDAEQLSFGKIGGGVLRFNTSLQRVSPGFEINDLGYLAQAGTESWGNWIGLQYQEPKSFYKQLFLNFNAYGAWSAEGISGAHLSTTSTNVNAQSELRNGWIVNVGLEGDNLLGVFDDRKARGGPAMFRHPYLSWWGGIQGDPRMKIVPSINTFGFNGSGGKSHGWGVDPQVLFTMSSNLALTVGLHYDLNIDYTQWVQNFSSGADTSTFAVLHQDTFSATIRLDATFTPKLSFQLFANPFISDGRYENWRALTDPRATTYDAQFTPYSRGDTTAASYNFNDQELIMNSVLRWEYRRGSAVYLVWQHGRNYYNQSQQYSGFDPGTNVNNLLSIHPINTFLVKMTYWLSL